MTVDELEERMSIEEFTRWMTLDDMREERRKKQATG
jgi:hypothetical protein